MSGNSGGSTSGRWDGRGNQLLRDLEMKVQNGKQGREEKRERHPTMAVRLEYTNGDQKGFLYGTLLGGPLYVPSHGIQFVFEGAHAHGWGQWEHGCWQVSIKGSNLEGIYWGLCDSKQSCVRVGENDDGEERPHVTSIEVVKAEIRGYPAEKRG
jgi:hypothetical protein